MIDLYDWMTLEELEAEKTKLLIQKTEIEKRLERIEQLKKEKDKDQ